MRRFGTQRWNILQRMVFVVRNFKSILFPTISNRRYSSKSIASNSASDFEITSELDGKPYYSSSDSYRSQNQSHVNREISTLNSKKQKIGDIVGIPTREEAKALQIKIEEETGTRLLFRLKPGDSVYQTFDEIAGKGYDIKKRRRSFKQLHDKQLLSVSANKRKYSDAGGNGLKLIADYLTNQISFDDYKSSNSREKNNLQRSASQIVLNINYQPSTSPVLSECKEYLKALATNFPQPSFKKLLSFKKKRRIEKNPIIVVTDYK